MQHSRPLPQFFAALWAVFILGVAPVGPFPVVEAWRMWSVVQHPVGPFPVFFVGRG